MKLILRRTLVHL